MEKSRNMDTQILVNILKIQKDMESLISELDKNELVKEIVKDRVVCDLLQFNMMKVIALTTNLTNKTKKESISYIDNFESNLVLDNLSKCYPSISDESIVKYALKICDESSIWETEDTLKEYLYSSNNE